MKPKKVFSLSAVTTLLLVAGTSAFAQAITRIRDLPALKTPTTISGRVVGFGEADENEWIIEDSSGQVRVEAGPRRWRNINLSEGETITVLGEMDDGEFDAFSITRSNGSIINIRSPKGPPPWADKDEK